MKNFDKEAAEAEEKIIKKKSIPLEDVFVDYYGGNNDKQEKITITLEEYKELLMIKGRYEELARLADKSVIPNPVRINWDWNKTIYRDIPEDTYKVTMETGEK